MARVTVKVDDDTKQEWEQYADDAPHIDSLSHLIRYAVETERADGADGDTEKHYDAPTEDLESIKQQLQQLETLVRAVEQQQSTSGEIADEVLATLELASIPDDSLEMMAAEGAEDDPHNRVDDLSNVGDEDTTVHLTDDTDIEDLPDHINPENVVKDEEGDEDEQ